jgi:hypothetical protein
MEGGRERGREGEKAEKVSSDMQSFFFSPM